MEVNENIDNIFDQARFTVENKELIEKMKKNVIQILYLIYTNLGECFPNIIPI